MHETFSKPCEVQLALGNMVGGEKQLKGQIIELLICPILRQWNYNKYAKHQKSAITEKTTFSNFYSKSLYVFETIYL